MSLQLVQSFNFFHLDTPVHRMDPRAKFVMLITYSVLSFLLDSLILQMLLLAMLVPVIYLAHDIKRAWKGLLALKFLLFFIILVNTYVVSLNAALVISLRIITLMLVFSIFFQTTLPEDLTQSLIKIGVPYHVAFAISLAFRFVPTMAKETETIMNAQKSRGHRIQEGGIIRQVRNLLPLLVPLLLNSIRRAFHVAEALETRGFGVKKKPSFYYPLKFTWRDWLFVVLQVSLLSVGIFIAKGTQFFPGWLYWELPL